MYSDTTLIINSQENKSNKMYMKLLLKLDKEVTKIEDRLNRLNRIVIDSNKGKTVDKDINEGRRTEKEENLTGPSKAESVGDYHKPESVEIKETESIPPKRLDNENCKIKLKECFCKVFHNDSKDMVNLCKTFHSKNKHRIRTRAKPPKKLANEKGKLKYRRKVIYRKNRRWDSVSKVFHTNCNRQEYVCKVFHMKCNRLENVCKILHNKYKIRVGVKPPKKLDDENVSKVSHTKCNRRKNVCKGLHRKNRCKIRAGNKPPKKLADEKLKHRCKVFHRKNSVSKVFHIKCNRLENSRKVIHSKNKHRTKVELKPPMRLANEKLKYGKKVFHRKKQLDSECQESFPHKEQTKGRSLQSFPPKNQEQK